MVSLGCAKNRVDSEQMLGLMRGAGFDITDDPMRASVLIVNTCGFIQTAKEESINTLLDMARYKSEGACRALIATGCLVQRYAGQLREEMPEIDAFVGLTEYPRLPEIALSLLEENDASRPIAVKPAERVSPIFEGARELTTNSATAYVRISDGCDNRCAYCAIPNIRGPYRSRAMSAVLDETASLVERGVKEIVFIAQDTTRFGDDTEGGLLLPELLRLTAEMRGVQWVRALYAYPSRVSDELLDTLANVPKVCPYLDVPLQHVDADILRRMRRWGDPDSITALLTRARRLGLTLRTTFLVGFPGETDDAFKRLMDFTESFQIDRMGAFAYSPEEDTPAFDMEDAVPDEIKQERLDRLMRAQRKASFARNRLRIGEVETVLIEGARGGDLYQGRSRREAPESDGFILVRSDRPLAIGDFVSVKMTGARAYDLEGDAYEPH